MLKSRLAVLLALLLSIACWFNVSASAMAQTFPQTTSLSVATVSGEKSLFSFAGKRPTDLGVNQGQLLACPNTPNCVSSQSTNAEQKVEPLSYSAEPAQAWATLKAALQELPRTEVITEESNYLYAESTSALMGFVDDVEFYLDDAAKVIHIRSASRLGKSDLGVNRKRVEAIRAKFAELASKAQ